MMNLEKPGALRRVLRAVGRALKRGLLGRSTHSYMKQFTHIGAHSSRAIAAGPGVGGPPPAQGPGAGADRSESEPVHGWTRRQRDDYLARNPGYRVAYEAALQKCCHESSARLSASAQAEDALVPDGRAGLTPADMVGRRLEYLLTHVELAAGVLLLGPVAEARSRPPARANSRRFRSW
jgi:hypothetical protein